MRLPHIEPHHRCHRPVEGIGIIIITIVLMIVVVTRSARQMQGQIRNATRLIATALRATHAGAEGDSWPVLRPSACGSTARTPAKA